MTATPLVNKALGIALVDVTVLLPVAELRGSSAPTSARASTSTPTALHVEASAPDLHAQASAASTGFQALIGIGVVDADATNSSQVEAFVGAHRSIDASNVTTTIDTHGGAASILVNTKLRATATAETDSFSGLVTLGVISPTAKIDGYVGGYVRDGVDLTAGSLGLKVGNTGVGERVVIAAVADAQAVGVGGVLSGNVAVSEAITAGVVEAFIGAASGRTRGGNPAANIELGGALDVIAASDMDATATANGAGVGGISFNVLIPTAWVLGATRAFAGDGTNIRTSSLNLLADSDVKASATTAAISVGLLGAVNGGSAEAVVASDTEAFLGERFDTIRLTQATVQVLDGAGNPGTVNIDAISVSVAEAKNDGLAASLGVAVSVLLPKAKLSGFTRAYLGPRTTVTAGSIDVLAKDNESRATASTLIGSVAAVGISVVDSNAKVSRATEAFVGHHANLILGGGALTLTAWSPQVRAVSTTRGFTGGALADIAVFSTFALHRRRHDLPPVRRRPRRVRGPGRQLHRGRPTKGTRSVTRAFIDNDAIVGAGTVLLDADSDAESSSTIKHTGIAGFVSVSVAEVNAITEQDTEAFVGDRATISSGRPLTMNADDNLRAIPVLEAFNLGGGVQVGAFNVHSHMAGGVYAGVGDGTSVTATGLTIHAKGLHRPATEVATTGIGGLAAVTVFDASAKDDSSVTARIGPSGAPADATTRR